MTGSSCEWKNDAIARWVSGKEQDEARKDHDALDHEDSVGYHETGCSDENTCRIELHEGSHSFLWWLFHERMCYEGLGITVYMLIDYWLVTYTKFGRGYYNNRCSYFYIWTDPFYRDSDEFMWTHNGIVLAVVASVLLLLALFKALVSKDEKEKGELS